MPARAKTTPAMTVLLDRLGRRWALRVVWELRSAPATFRDLRERCDGPSPTVLNARLKELRESGIVSSKPDGYALTTIGHALVRAIAPLDRFAKRWSGSDRVRSRSRSPRDQRPSATA